MTEPTPSNRGKWSQPEVPHKGWSCVGIEDLGEPSAVCEMCETQEIRYVHSMQHPHYPQILMCGCVCAGYMEEDPAWARQREGELRSISSRRQRWLSRNWRISRSGNSYLNVEGRNVVVYPGAAGRWGCRAVTSPAELSSAPLSQPKTRPAFRPSTSCSSGDAGKDGGIVT